MQYNYGIFDSLRKRLQTKADAELIEAQALKTIAEQPADKVNPLVFIIPVAAIIVLGIVVIVIKRKK